MRKIEETTDFDMSVQSVVKTLDRSPVLDDKYHRLGPRERYWYIGGRWEAKGWSGRSITCGDWQTGEQKSFFDRDHGVKGDDKFSKKLLDPVFAQKEKTIDLKKRELQDQRAKELQDYWKTLRDYKGGHPYWEERFSGYPGHLGSGLKVDADGWLLIPMVNLDGTLRNAQKIDQSITEDEDGRLIRKKRFLWGCQVDGCYYLIPGTNPNGPILFAEGVVTGEKLWLASDNEYGATVVCAMTADNLVKVVYQWKNHLEKANKKRILQVCGDDDWHPTDKNGKPKVNKGHEKAEVASKLTGRQACYPIWPEGYQGKKGTDFDDLERATSLEVVSACIAQALITDVNDQHHVDPSEMWYRQTEEKPIRELVAMFVKDKRPFYDDDSGRLMIYKHPVWEPCTPKRLRWFARYYDAELSTSKSRRESFASDVESICVARDIPWMNVPKHSVVFNDGVYDSRDLSRICDIRPNHYLKSVMPFSLDKTAKCPVWMKFLDDCFRGDYDQAEKLECLQMFCGYILLLHARYKKGLILWGPKDTGKSVFKQLFEALFGIRNICEIDVHLMGSPRECAPIEGKILNIVEELNHDALINDKGFKKMVSTGGSIAIEPKYVNQFSIVSHAKHVICTNTLPRINDRSNATYERLLIIQFNNPVPKQLQDKHLMDKLKDELPGIVWWMAQGLMALENNFGEFTEPPSQAAIIAQHKKDGNPLTMWLEECCEIGENYREHTKSLNASYQGWAKKNNVKKPVDVRNLPDFLKMAGFINVQEPFKIFDKRARGFEGLKLKYIPEYGGPSDD